jgi:hypothetical protein
VMWISIKVLVKSAVRMLWRSIWPEGFSLYW